MSNNDPERIWLQGCDECDDPDCPALNDQRTWCQDQIHENDCEYFRADLHRARIASLEQTAEDQANTILHLREELSCAGMTTEEQHHKIVSLERTVAELRDIASFVFEHRDASKFEDGVREREMQEHLRGLRRLAAPAADPLKCAHGKDVLSRCTDCEAAGVFFKTAAETHERTSRTLADFGYVPGN